MATFDPQGQFGNDPSYLNYPRVIDMPATQFTERTNPTNLAAGLLGEGVKAVGFTDAAIKEGIKNRAYADVDPERDKFTSALESVKKQLDQGTIPGPTKTVGGPSTGSVFDAHAEATDDDLPDGLQSGIDRVNQLAYARAAGSAKINDTQYSAAVLSIAKQMRNEYRGYREEVDNAVSQASGLPVANSYYQNLMVDINRQLMQLGKTQKDDMPGIMKQNMDYPGKPDQDPAKNVPNMGQMYWMRQNGDPKYPGDAFVLDQISKWRNLQTQQDIDAKKRAENKDDDAQKVKNETQNVTKTANDYVNFFVSNNVGISGIPTYRELANWVTTVGAKGIAEGVAQGDEQTLARLMQLRTYRNMIYQHINNATTASGQVIGEKQRQDILTAALSPIDGYLELAGGKDANIGLAQYHMLSNKAIQEDAFNNVLVNKDTRAGTLQLLTARKAYGDQYFPQWIMNSPPDVQQGMQSLFQQEKLFAVQDAQDSRGQPLPSRKLIDAVQHAKQVNNPDPNLYKSFIDIVHGIADPQMPATMKDKLIAWGFDPKNKGLINEFRQDYYDKDGNFVPGKFAAFNRLTSPVITAEVAKSSAHDPEQYKNYKGFAESEFANAFRGDLQDLNKIMGKSYLNAHFGWDSDNGHFILVDKNNRPIQYQERAMAVEQPDRVYLNQALTVLKRVNEMGIDNLVKVYTADPSATKGDIGSYLLQTLQTSGFRPGENITNASEGMARSIIKAKKPEITLQEIDKALGLK